MAICQFCERSIPEPGTCCLSCARIAIGDDQSGGIQHRAGSSGGGTAEAARTGRKPSGRSPTESTLAELRRRGWTHAKTEHWQPSYAAQEIVQAATKGGDVAGAVAKYRRAGPGVRVDLFGFCDVLACVPPADDLSEPFAELGHLLAIQTTSQTGVSARVKKIATECAANALAWLDSGGRISVWGWSKVGSRWQLREREITREMIADVTT